MAEITEKAYEDLRGYVQENWKYIELGDENGDAILRLTTSDERVSWTHSEGDKELKLQVRVSGADSDIESPQTFTSSSIYKVETGGDAYSKEEFSQFTIESENDELTVIHSIQIPQIN